MWLEGPGREYPCNQAIGASVQSHNPEPARKCPGVPAQKSHTRKCFPSRTSGLRTRRALKTESRRREKCSSGRTERSRRSQGVWRRRRDKEQS
ncbi:hypothetical protein NDU88_005522 [Pleurodeles waltl]|uniref:Uncharacterized protein n=1 Tax=Pleurodeles waltl TaxID=8319 RepID=A0AAV7RMF9_PLEWA|nr:hypothetical protein NDU88_005522 [Pleurodeles waltl]